MKQIVPFLFLCLMLVNGQTTYAQITSPQIRAGFGIDADLSSNFFNNVVQSGNDDWFTNAAGTGISVIDTTGAAQLISQYLSNANTREVPVFRGMSYPPFSVQNNKLLVDAIFIRDHHGTDSSSFISGNKNAMNPANWQTGVTPVTSKADILDMYMHVRRDGVNASDSLWFFGALSLDGVSGNRAFDFEMYQTDIVYDVATKTFSGYGPDEGHTSWEFDAAGNVVKAGDIIFAAYYQNSSLSSLEARIWVSANTKNSVTPAAFSWGTDFDGATSGSNFGYAKIVPKTSGNFYSGTQTNTTTWAGVFQVVLANNSLSTTYTADQFMEISVNLSKLGLDPFVSLNNACAFPFRRLMVKTRSSESFTSALNDFIAPFTLFRVPAADITANFTTLCNAVSVSDLQVSNPVSTSTYNWIALTGNIVGSTTGTKITVNQPGTYVVQQRLMNSCTSNYATDTIVITSSSNCFTLDQWIKDFTVKAAGEIAHVHWNSVLHGAQSFFELQRSEDGIHFVTIRNYAATSLGQYTTTDDLNHIQTGWVYYRIKYNVPTGHYFSNVQSVYLNTKEQLTLTVAPNPITDMFKLQFMSVSAMPIEVSVKNQTGQKLYNHKMNASSGLNTWQIQKPSSWTPGIYIVEISKQGEVMRKRILVQ